jgi:hypothetical protein
LNRFLFEFLTFSFSWCFTKQSPSHHSCCVVRWWDWMSHREWW